MGKRRGRGRTGCYGAAGGVDVEVDWFLWVIGFEEKELGDYGGGHGFFNFTIEADDSFLQQSGEDVVSMPAASLYNLISAYPESFDNRVIYHCLCHKWRRSPCPRRTAR
jgi:ribosomal protein L15